MVKQHITFYTIAIVLLIMVNISNAQQVDTTRYSTYNISDLSGKSDSTAYKVQYKQTYAAIVMFGLLGLGVGTYVGSLFDRPHVHHIEGELPDELFTPGMAIGAISGAAIGGFIGYHLGREPIFVPSKQDSLKSVKMKK